MLEYIRLTLGVALVALASLAAAAGEHAQHWSYWGPTVRRIGRGSARPQSCNRRSTSRRPPRRTRNFRRLRSRTDRQRSISSTMASIQVDVDKGSTLTVGGVRFPLAQFHFHKPSEEEIDGRASAMVVHLVHRDAEGNLAVVAVPIIGGSNSMVETLWRNLPRQKGHELSPVGAYYSSVAASAGGSRLFYICRIADDAAVHRGRAMVRAALPGQPFARGDRALLPNCTR